MNTVIETPKRDSKKMRRLFEDMGNYQPGETAPENVIVIQECDCKGFAAQKGIAFDDQDLRDMYATKCPCCGKPFKTRAAETDVKIKYRITSSRPSEASQVCEEPVFEGETREACDEQAKTRLEELGANPSNKWEDFSLYRIDVEEVTTPIASNNPENHTENAKRTTVIHRKKE